ncbi:unnamed protein product, partial [Rotaria sp. Silwood1]
MNLEALWPMDLRYTLSAMWQIIAGLCRSATNFINDALTEFASEPLISYAAFTEAYLNVQIQAELEDAWQSAIDRFGRHLNIIQTIAQIDGFMTGVSTNFVGTSAITSADIPLVVYLWQTGYLLPVRGKASLEAFLEMTRDEFLYDILLVKNILHAEQYLNNETFPQTTQLNIEIDDDTKSESSIEYDYTNPLSVSLSTNHIHVSIATIYLQDEQWHQLELFIKHFSLYVSLSNNLNVTSSTTHLLVDDSSHPFQCNFSKKIFQAVARHIFIVSIRWIEKFLLQNEIIDETPYKIHGDETMKTMHLTCYTSINTLFSSSILFAIDCTSFQRVLTRNDLIELVILSNAKLFDPEQQKSIEIQSKLLLVLVDPRVD